MTPGPTPRGNPHSGNAIRVSLAGSADVPRVSETMTAALDDAAAALSAVTGTAIPDDRATDRDRQHQMQLIEIVSSAPSRRDAIAKLVDHLAEKSGHPVRCGIGKDQLKLLYDARLGWLGPESSVHRAAADVWHAAADGSLPPSPAIERTDDALAIHLPQADDGPGHCTIWITDSNPASGALRWLTPIASTLAVVFWSRPGLSWPAMAAGHLRQSSGSITIAALVLLAIVIWPVHYRIDCNAVVETTRQRIVATPFEATILTTHVKPGDAVDRGQVLVRLDGRPLRLEREAIRAELQQVVKEHDVALASRRIAEAQQASLKEKQLQRRYELLTDRLSRLDVISPIDGIVVSGDLDKYVGTPVKLGQTLMEIAPMDRMHIEVEIPEYEIGYVSDQADVRVKLDAIGGSSLRLRMDRIHPSAELRDDKNVFVGRVVVDNSDHRMKPGMRGGATTYGPVRPWFWSWIRGGFERVLWWIGY